MSKADKIWVYLMGLADRRWGCHQLADRSFYLCKYQMPICARCTGVLIGYIVSLLLFNYISLLACFALASVMLVDWLLQHFGILQSTNIRRLITGVLGGIGCMCAFLKIIVFMVRFMVQA